MPRTDRQLDTERPDRSEERRKAREAGARKDEDRQDEESSE